MDGPPWQPVRHGNAGRGEANDDLVECHNRRKTNGKPTENGTTC
ncbi:unnamed protein product [Penicillium roqueforti FM164]|uniref:Genomic scaffold, ProqFM164S03 n=1 Tax=Penicillium roqueforti (strain FM164) TaxID=1365484 RepID=W6QJ42_PENRF|nr:unnamed protein product [Penicillium roqueforti FM164]